MKSAMVLPIRGTLLLTLIETLLLLPALWGQKHVTFDSRGNTIYDDSVMTSFSAIVQYLPILDLSDLIPLFMELSQWTRDFATGTHHAAKFNLPFRPYQFTFLYGQILTSQSFIFFVEFFSRSK